MRVSHWKMNITKRGAHEVVIIRAGKGSSLHVVEVTESPTGRSVQVHIDGRKVDLFGLSA